MSSLHPPPGSSQHLLQPDNASLASGHHIQHQFYGDMQQRNSHTPPVPANASPRFTAISPATQPSQGPNRFIPSDRQVPSRDVSDETLDSAYAAFILYCNPNFPTTADTSELTKLFRIPPKSDGKAFSTWTLFELIRKFDAKEIKTWSALALELGVEPPDIDKGQSTQKVQQYSVRLKRWMRAMHIDSFFEYLLGKEHVYYMNIPPPHDPFPEGGRDGVPLEEDLAIRAIDPKFRPKRGRKKAEDGDDDLETADGTPPRKRPQLDTSIPFGNALQPQSAYPGSAHPDHMEGFLGGHDHWPTSAITPSTALTAASAPSRLSAGKNMTPYSPSPLGGQQIRWKVAHDVPQTPHPLSAITPHSAHDFFDEPQSAVTPSSSRARSRRRHGPAVSSAWPSQNTSSSGKLRGRPPTNRSVRDGPFVTFPANPNTKEGPTIDVKRNAGNLTPIVERAQSDPPAADHHFRLPPTPASAVTPDSNRSIIPAVTIPQKPHRLSLQVPPNVGNPVRLVAPTVLVTGEQDVIQNPTPVTGLASSAIHSERPPHGSFFDGHDHFTQQTPQTASTPSYTPSQGHPSPHTRLPASTMGAASSPIPQVSVDTLNRALAAELIRAQLKGRKKRLRGTEAKNLASAILQPLYATSNSGPSASAKNVNDHMLGIIISGCLGLGSAVGLGAGGPNGSVRRLECVRFRVGGDGYEDPIDDDEEDADTMNDGSTIRESFNVTFNVSFGPMTGEWDIKGLSPISTDLEDDEAKRTETEAQETPDTVAGWKAKFLDTQRKLWASQEGEKLLREKILEAVL